nr:hypothetical protein containing chorismate mutase type II motif [uncultured archaeon]
MPVFKPSSKLSGGSVSVSHSLSCMCLILFSYVYVIPFIYKYNLITMLPEEEKLDEIRKRIDEIDAAIVDLLSKRMAYAKQIKDVKVRMNMPIKDGRREEMVIENWCEHARRNRRGGEYDLSEEMMKKMAALIIEYTVNNELLANNSDMSV